MEGLLYIIITFSVMGLVILGLFGIISLTIPEFIDTENAKFMAKWILIVGSVAFVLLGVIEGLKFYKELKQMEIDAVSKNEVFYGS